MFILLVVGFILFLPFYVFLAFVYIKITSWETALERFVSDPRNNKNVKKVINLTENVLMQRAVPIVIDKFDDILNALDRFLPKSLSNLSKGDDPVPERGCESDDH